MGVKRAKGDGVKCHVCVRGYDQEVDPDDTYASTPSLITLKLLLTLAVAHGWHILAGDVSTAFLHALLTDEVFVIPPVEYYPNGGVLWKLRKAMYGLTWRLQPCPLDAVSGFDSVTVSFADNSVVCMRAWQEVYMPGHVHVREGVPSAFVKR